MTTEQKELLIKDLCARLPYGVKVMTSDIDRGNIHKFNGGIYTLDSIDARGFIEVFEEDMGLVSVDEIKPIFFPLSVIYRDIEINKVRICVSSYINDSVLSSGIFLNPIYADIESWGNISLEEYSSILDTFHRYHIDYRNLIGQGLAISVFDLPENPYK